MNIVVLDGYTANPGDLSWAEFDQFGPCTVHDRTPEGLVVERARDAQIVLTNKFILSRATIAALPRLRYIGVLATGHNVVDTIAARERGIPVCNVPEYSTPNVAQAVFALLLELTNHTGHHTQTVRDGRWCAAKDFCYWDRPLVELQGLTLGLVGHGRIGQAVERIGLAFGMRVMTCGRGGDLDSLLRASDVVSLHCPLTPETQQLVNTVRLAQMKPTALLINTARGGLIHEADLANALNRDQLAGAGLDVLSTEPPSPDNPLLQTKNCLITPHIAWATRDARVRLLKIAAANIRAWLLGQPQNLVNAPA